MTGKAAPKKKPPAKTATKAVAGAAAPKASKKAAPKASGASSTQTVQGTISSFDDSSGTGYVSVGDKWWPLDLSTVKFENDHFVHWQPGRKVRATISDSRVESIRVDDEYTQS